MLLLFGLLLLTLLLISFALLLLPETLVFRDFSFSITGM